MQQKKTPHLKIIKKMVRNDLVDEFNNLSEDISQDSKEDFLASFDLVLRNLENGKLDSGNPLGKLLTAYGRALNKYKAYEFACKMLEPMEKAKKYASSKTYEGYASYFNDVLEKPTRTGKRWRASSVFRLEKQQEKIKKQLEPALKKDS